MKLIALRPIPNSVGEIPKGQAFEAVGAHAQRLLDEGMATSSTNSPWSGIAWPGATVVILASGDSLSLEQCSAVRRWRELPDAAPPRRVIAINTTFRRAPWADVLYGCDAPWWRVYMKDVKQTFAGDLWTQDEPARREFDINWIESRNAPGLSRKPGLIHQGGNGGYQAINLAAQAGAKRMILLGFDMRGTHWHGKHPSGLSNTPDHMFKTWIQKFEHLAADLAADGIEVKNCTPESALNWFPHVPLSEALA